LLKEIREAVGGSRGESLAWRAASLIQMERNSVYNQIYNDRTLLVLDIMRLAEKQSQKFHDIWALVRTCLRLHKEASFGSQSANSRDVVASQRHAQDRRFAQAII